MATAGTRRWSAGPGCRSRPSSRSRRQGNCPRPGWVRPWTRSRCGSWTSRRLVAKGMAVRLAMPDEGGLDRLVVLGVRDAPATDSAAVLARLLDVHRTGDGLGLLTAGTPTNNSANARSAWTRPDAGGIFDAALRPAAPGSDSVATARALGVPAAALSGLPHQVDSSGTEARAMHRALWPATFGYVLETFGGSEVDDATVEAARRLFVGAVRGLGPLPLICVGRQPYGVLPATSLRSWTPAADDATGRIVSLLRRLAPLWLDAADRVPHVGRPGADPDQELLDILGRDGLSGGYRIRPMRGRLLNSGADRLGGRPGPGGRTPDRCRVPPRRRCGSTTAGRSGVRLPGREDPRGHRHRGPAVGDRPAARSLGVAQLPEPPRGARRPERRLRRSRCPRRCCMPWRVTPRDWPTSTPPYVSRAPRAWSRRGPGSSPSWSTSTRARQARPRPGCSLGRSGTCCPQRPPDGSVSDFIATATPAEVSALGLPHVREAWARATDVRRALGGTGGRPDRRGWTG